MGKTYDFNTADTLNTLLLNCIFASGQLKEGEMYDVDFDHQFIETEKYDAKPTYKKFLGYRPGVAVIGDLIVGIENSDGNTNVRFHQKDTLKRFFERFEQNGLTINRFRADCGSCSEEIVEEIEKHCKSFYIRANRYAVRYAIASEKIAEKTPTFKVIGSQPFANHRLFDVFRVKTNLLSNPRKFKGL